MIRTSKQLKDKVRNMSKGDSTKAQMLIRNYMMERFLERISISKYRDNFVLKGGMLVASIIGIEARTTMDIDTSIRYLSLAHGEAKEVIDEIIGVSVADEVSFRVTKYTDIMEGHDYPGIRFNLEGSMDNLTQTIKIDLSTGDVITPSEVLLSYKLMFEERTIPIWTYNLETLLSEKLETIMIRSTANTRMRDFYDIHSLLNYEGLSIDKQDLKHAFIATCEKRRSSELMSQMQLIIDEIRQNSAMKNGWISYSKDNYFVGELDWENVINSVIYLVDLIE